jgi:hypothetical protein
LVTNVKDAATSTINSYLERFSGGRLLKFVRENIDPPTSELVEIIQTHETIRQQVTACLRIFKGEEVYIADHDYVKTDCDGSLPFSSLTNAKHAKYL